MAHLGFKVTGAALRRMEKKLKDNGIAIERRRGKSAFYILDPNGYQVEYDCD